MGADHVKGNLVLFQLPDQKLARHAEHAGRFHRGQVRVVLHDGDRLARKGGDELRQKLIQRCGQALRFAVGADQLPRLRGSSDRVPGPAADRSPTKQWALVSALCGAWFPLMPYTQHMPTNATSGTISISEIRPSYNRHLRVPSKTLQDKLLKISREIRPLTIE